MKEAIPLDKVKIIDDDESILGKPIPLSQVKILGDYDYINEKIMPTNDIEKKNFEETILQSAVKDVKQVASGFGEMAKEAGKALAFPKQTIFKFVNWIKQEYQKGTLDDDIKEFAKSLVEPFKNIGGIGGEIAGELTTEPSKAVKTVEEKILRRPASFGLDLMAVLGAVRPTVKALSKALSSETSKKIAARTGELLTGTPYKSVLEKIKNSDLIKNARTYEQIKEEIPNAFKTLQDKIDSKLNMAYDALNDSTKIYSKKDVINLAKSQIKNIKPVGDVNKQIINKVNSFIDDISKNYADNLTQLDLKEILKSLDNEVNWLKQDYDKNVTEGIKRVRNSIDALVKVDNPEYAQAMKEVSELVENKVNVKRILDVKEHNGEIFVSDTTTKKISDLNRFFKQENIKELSEFAKHTGLDIPNESALYKIKSDFEKSFIQGSRRATTGTAIGMGIAGKEGAMIGGAAGYILDKWGPKLLEKGIETTSPVFQSIIKNADRIPKGMTAVTFIRAFEKEKEDHPKLDDEAIVNIVFDEMNKNKKFYDKNK